MDNVSIIGVFNFVDMFIWIDALYDVHPNMCSQTGGVMSMCHEMLHGWYSNQNMNAKRFTGAGLKETNEYVAFNVLWLYF